MAREEGDVEVGDAHFSVASEGCKSRWKTFLSLLSASGMLTGMRWPIWKAAVDWWLFLDVKSFEEGGFVCALNILVGDQRHLAVRRTRTMSWDCGIGAKQEQTFTFKVSLRRVELVVGKSEAVNDGHVHH